MIIVYNGKYNEMPQFDQKNQPKKRKGRGKSKVTHIITALKNNSSSEQDFWDKLVNKALFGGVDGDGDSVAQKEIANRLMPMTKQTLPIFDFNISDKQTKLEKADAIIDAIGQGAIPADVGKIFMDIIKDASTIEELEDHAARIEELEKLYEQSISKED